MGKTISRSKNAEDSADTKVAHRMKKEATAPKGRMNQPKGSSKHNTSPKYAKSKKNPGKDMEF